MAAFCNGFFLPYCITFRVEHELEYHLFLAVFVLDFLLRFRVTIFDKEAGDEITTPKDIALHYAKTLNFIFDLLAIIPFAALFGKNHILDYLQMLKLLSLSRVDINLGNSEIVKVLLRLMTILLTLTLYIHFSTCLIYTIAFPDRKWIPPNCIDQFDADSFYSLKPATQYLYTLYSSILVLTGNEM